MSIVQHFSVIFIFILINTSCGSPTIVSVPKEPANIQARIKPGDNVKVVTKNKQEYEFEVVEVSDEAIIGINEKVLYSDITTIDEVYASGEKNFIIGATMILLGVLVVASGGTGVDFSDVYYRLKGEHYGTDPIVGSEEFTVFDITLDMRLIEEKNPAAQLLCPSTRNMQLFMLKSNNEIFGSVELAGVKKRIYISSVSGLVEDLNFSFLPFSIEKSNDLQIVRAYNPSNSPSIEPSSMLPASAEIQTKSEIPSSSISLKIMKFQGQFTDIDENGLVNGIEGKVSGIVSENQENIVICDSEKFDGVFSGKAINSINAIKIEK